jgi:hypothetical protein
MDTAMALLTIVLLAIAVGWMELDMEVTRWKNE